ncbi:MAG: energy transducer TonB [Sphingobium sp.]|nr:energy transducer TonB [Sphingobium sp.]
MIAWLVETLVATTALMLLVLAIRGPVRQFFGSHAAYALWLLPALRMILPPLGALLTASTPLSSVMHSSGAAVGLVRSEIVVETITGTAPAAAMGETAAQGAIWPILLAALWAAGLMIFALHQYLAYRRFCGFILREATLRDEIAPGVMLVSSPKARGPMAFGVRRRFIVFPADAEKRFDEEERAMALAHELAHHTRGDLIANIGALAILTLHWCNPIAWIAYRAFRTDQEMACDADVIAAVRGSHLGHAYGRALVKSASGHEFAAACNLTTVDRLKRRLAMLSNKSPSNRRRRTGIVLAGAVVLSGLALTASGEGMAAQVGARVSDALPKIPRMQDVLPSLPAVAAIPALPVAHAADPDKDKDKDKSKSERRVKTIIITTSADGVALPAPPAPPVPGAAPTPPVPPTPPHVMLLPPGGADGKQIRIIRHITKDGKEVTVEGMPPMPPLPPEVNISENCDTKGEPVTSTTELKSPDGKTTRTVTRVMICKRSMAGGHGEGLSGLKEARADLAKEKGLPDKVRDEVLADLDRTIARIEAQEKDKK